MCTFFQFTVDFTKERSDHIKVTLEVNRQRMSFVIMRSSEIVRVFKKFEERILIRLFCFLLFIYKCSEEKPLGFCLPAVYSRILNSRD